MKVHPVTVEVDSIGRLWLTYANRQCGVQLLLDQFASRWGVAPTVRERDLAHIAAAIYAADRMVKRPGRGMDTARYIRLNISIFGGELVDSPLLNSLSDLLGFLSGDEWDIRLQPCRKPAEAPVQRQLAFSEKPGFRVCLYSDGPDSAAGLALRRNEVHKPWLAVTVGHQTGLRHRVIKQLRAHRENLPHPLLSAQLVAGLRSAPPIGQQEKTQRTRGVLFCVAAGLAARWSGARQVEVFENGVGAFNLPLMTGMLDGGRTTRGAHPQFLSQMGGILSAVLNHPLDFVLPFCWDTKAEMLQRLPADQARQLIELSHTCVHTSIRERGKDHCGTCPACIERQITLNAAGLADRLSRYQHVWEAHNTMARDTDLYIRFRGRRANNVINNSDDYRTLVSDYMRACGLKLPANQNREFKRLMRRDSREYLAWAAGEDGFSRQGVANYAH